jgi:hypothetical protein
MILQKSVSFFSEPQSLTFKKRLVFMFMSCIDCLNIAEVYIMSMNHLIALSGHVCMCVSSRCSGSVEIVHLHIHVYILSRNMCSNLNQDFKYLAISNVVFNNCMGCNSICSCKVFLYNSSWVCAFNTI